MKNKRTCGHCASPPRHDRRWRPRNIFLHGKPGDTKTTGKNKDQQLEETVADTLLQTASQWAPREAPCPSTSNREGFITQEWRRTTHLPGPVTQAPLMKTEVCGINSKQAQMMKTCVAPFSYVFFVNKCRGRRLRSARHCSSSPERFWQQISQTRFCN